MSMDKEEMIQTLLQVVDLNSGIVDSAGLAKKLNESERSVEEFLIKNEIVTGGYGPLRLMGGLLQEAREMRNPKPQME